MTLIDVTCAQCGVVYHSDRVHVGKRIKCSRCGSMVPILEGASGVAERPAVVVPATVSPRRKREPRLIPISAVGVAAIVALIALTLMWFHFGDKVIDNHSELQRPGKIAHNPSDVSLGRAAKTSGNFEVADLDTTHSNVGATIRTELAPSREPEPRPSFYRSLPTGAHFCRSTRTTGEGVLKIENGTSEDAALRLFDASSQQTIRCVFMKAHASASITGIPEGIYGLKYTTGLDWRDKTFRWLPSYSRFEQKFAYSEKRVANEIQYHEIRVTLHPVVGGNVRTISISPEEFQRGSEDASLLP